MKELMFDFFIRWLIFCNFKGKRTKALPLIKSPGSSDLSFLSLSATPFIDWCKERKKDRRWVVRQQEWPGWGGYKYEYHYKYKYKYKYQGRRTEGRGETARITWLREIGVDTGATDCQIFTHFKQNKFIQKNSPMDDFIYLLPSISFCN